MVGMASGDFLCPVELLNKEQTHKLVWEDKRREGPYKVSASSEGIIHAIGTTDDKYGRLTSWECLFNLARKGRGIKELTAFIEQNNEIIVF